MFKKWWGVVNFKRCLSIDATIVLSIYPSQCFDSHLNLCVIFAVFFACVLRFSCGVADIIANDQTLLDVEKTLKQAAKSLGGMMDKNNDRAGGTLRCMGMRAISHTILNFVMRVTREPFCFRRKAPCAAVGQTCFSVIFHPFLSTASASCKIINQCMFTTCDIIVINVLGCSPTK